MAPYILVCLIFLFILTRIYKTKEYNIAGGKEYFVEEYKKLSEFLDHGILRNGNVPIQGFYQIESSKMRPSSGCNGAPFYPLVGTSGGTIITKKLF